MKISTNQFKNGTKLIIDNAPCSIVSHEFHKPGKGQAVMRIKYKNLLTGNTNDKTFKSGEDPCVILFSTLPKIPLPLILLIDLLTRSFQHSEMEG